MSDDDAVRDALRSEAARYDPVDDGWGPITGRVADARRRRRRMQQGVLGGVAAAVVVVLVGVSVTAGGGDDVDTTDDAGLAAATTSTTGETTTSAAPPTTGTTTTVAAPDVSGIWPFTDGSSISGPLAADRRFTDPVATARAFGRDYVGMVDPAAGEPRPAGEGAVEVDLRPRGEDGEPLPVGGASTTVTLLPLVTPEGRTLWTVASAASPHILVEQPDGADPITSPVAVRGTATGYEGTVVAEVRADGMLAGEALGREVGIAGSMGEMGPLALDVRFTPSATATGALVLTTDSGLQGVFEATVVRVRFGQGAPGTATTVPAGGCADIRPAGEPGSDEMDVTVTFVCGAGADPSDEATYVPVIRRVPRTAGVLGATVTAFLGGTTVEEEQVGGVSAFTYHAATTATVTLAGGRAVVDFSSELPEDATTATSSTGSLLFRGALGRTVLQFPTVEEVEYRLDGSCEAFWEWQQVGGCPIVTRADL
jgi:hypothetical protein